MKTASDPQGILRMVIIIAGSVVILAGVKGAASIIGPLLVALFVAILFGMLIRWLETSGTPHWLAVTIAIVTFLAVFAGFFLLIVASFTRMVAQIPAYQANIERTLHSAFSAAGIPLPSLSDVLTAFSDYSVEIISGLVTGITTLGLIIIASLFLLVEANSFTAKIERMLAGDPDMLERLSSLGKKIIDYVIIRTEVNLVTGVGIGLVIAGVGVEYAVFWGFLAFALSYIPYLGFWLAVIPPMLIAWSSLGPVPAVIILVGAAVINVVAENVLFPQAAGRGLDQSPAVVFISLVLWGYILGSIGALLAVPLTLALIMFLQSFDETRWLAALLGPADFVQLSASEDPTRGPSGPEPPE